MNRRLLIRLTICTVLATTGMALNGPAAHAGAYQVRSCFADGIAGIWQRSRTTDLADAYVECPEGINNNHGLYARNVLSSTPAPGFGSAQLVVNSPPGTYIDDIQFEANIAKSRNWQAGLWDAENHRWLWCGIACGTSFIWSSQHVGGFATNSLELKLICGASLCPSDGQLVAFLALRNVTLRLQDVWAPNVAIVGGSLASGGWKRGVQTVDVAGSDNTGVRSLRSSVDGDPQDLQVIGCDDHLLVPCPGSIQRTLKVDLSKFGDGQHTLQVTAVDAGGNATSFQRTVFVDNAALAPVENLAIDPSDWSTSNAFDVKWKNPAQDGGSPVAGVIYQLCPESSTTVGGCTPAAAVAKPLIMSLDDLKVPAPGAWRMRLWLVDEAGNHNDHTSREATLRWDPEPPSVRLLKRDDDDPTRISVAASDAISGLASAEIEVRREGDSAWYSLAVDRTQGGFTGVVDDEALPAGKYAVRARARDHAGNEQSTESTPMSITLPARLETNLAVGRRTLVRAGSRSRRRVLIRKPYSRFGKTIKLTGRLTSPGGNPLVGRDLEISEQHQLPGTGWVPIATVRSGRSGRFMFKALPGPSRLLRFRYGGTPTIRGDTEVVELHVRAASSMRASRRHVVNGQEVLFAGRVRSQPIPATGKLLQLQVYSRGTWLTFATPRADARGRWRHSYRFTATRGVTQYRFRVRLPRESGYPYDPGRSRTVRVKVTGL